MRGWDGRDAELLRRRVGARAGPARGDLHAAGLRRRLAARRRRAATRKRCSTSATSARSASTSPTAPAGRVGLGSEGSLRASYRLTRDDARRLAFGIARAAEVHFAAGATEVYPNIARVGVLKPGDLAEFEATRFKPSELRLEAFHPMGTARIAADPREGACAPDGSVNGTERPLRRRRLALPDLGRGQPDDDDHRLRQAGLRSSVVGAVSATLSAPSLRPGRSPRSAAFANEGLPHRPVAAVGDAGRRAGRGRCRAPPWR